MTTSDLALTGAPAVIADLRNRLPADAVWTRALDRVLDPARAERAHLAVMREPYLRYVLTGRKSVESRFSRHRVAPFDQVAAGDLLLLKAQSGPVSGAAIVAHADSYILDREAWASIRHRLSTAMCTEDDAFWHERRNARYATLMRLAEAQQIKPVAVRKSDRRPWVVLLPPAVTQVHRDQQRLLPREFADGSGSLRGRVVVRHVSRPAEATAQLPLF